jgi:epoxyqueuosine reductase
MESKSEIMQDLFLEIDVEAVGVADLSLYQHEVLGLPALKPGMYTRAICFGLAVSKSVLETLSDGPTPFYLHHYRQVNYRLDMAAYLLAREIEKQGYRALPFPASQLIDWQNQKGAISHKHLGQIAGLGWIGRNNLLVHPKYGSQMRYNTVFTDMPLEPTAPDPQFGCGTCRECIGACPAGAIADQPGDFDHQGCFAMLKQFRNQRNVGQYICGLCVKACRGER